MYVKKPGLFITFFDGPPNASSEICIERTISDIFFLAGSLSNL